MVTATDSSLIGWGVTRANWPVDEVRKHGRVSERSRFKKMPQGSSRVKALTQAGVIKHVDCKCDDNHDWFQDLSFPEIPAEFLRRSLWSECMSGAWGDLEDIGLLELRTVTKAVFDLMKYPTLTTSDIYFWAITWELFWRARGHARDLLNSLSNCVRFALLA